MYKKLTKKKHIFKEIFQEFFAFCTLTCKRAKSWLATLNLKNKVISLVPF